MSDDDDAGVRVGLFEQVGEMLDPSVMTLCMEMGGRGNLGASTAARAAEAIRQAMSMPTDQLSLVLSIGGYDEDPRSLWDVPDVVAFIRQVFELAGITQWSHPAVRMLNESSLFLLVKCGVFGRNHPFDVMEVDKGPNSDPFDRYEWTPP